MRPAVFFDPTMTTDLQRELDAKRLEFEELDLPRFQTGFPPQHLILTLLGDFWAGRNEPLPSAALVALLAEFEVNAAGARAAIARLARRGNLDVVRRGRTTSYRLAPRLAELMPYAPLHTQAFRQSRTDWDGRWTLVAFSIRDDCAALRARMRAGLETLRFGALHDGLWVSPYPPTEQLRLTLGEFAEIRCTVIVGHEVLDGVSPTAAWDTTTLRAVYDDFVATFTPVRDRMHAGTLSDTEALVAHIQVTYRWFVLATTDPDLPASLLPGDWPRNDAHRLFAQLVDGVGPQAERRVAELIARFAPELGRLVTRTRVAD